MKGLEYSKILIASLILVSCGIEKGEDASFEDPTKIEIGQDAYDIDKSSVLMTGPDSWSDYGVNAQAVIYYSKNEIIGDIEEELIKFCKEKQIKLVIQSDFSEGTFVKLNESIWFDIGFTIMKQSDGVLAIKKNEVELLKNPKKITEELEEFYK